MESYRTSKGPRHRKILNLGKLDIPRDQWKILTNRIEAILSGQSSYISVDEHIESLASHYASLIIQKSLAATVEAEASDYETVDINSLSNSRSRTIGAEYVGLSMFRGLGLNALFNSLGFTQDQINLAVLSVVGRLVSPASEKGTREWAQYLSSLDELLGTDFSRLSNNAIYRISDSLLSYKEEIERHLKVTECNLFSLREKIILYDLANTYFEVRSRGHPLKGPLSREKRPLSKKVLFFLFFYHTDSA